MDKCLTPANITDSTGPAALPAKASGEPRFPPSPSSDKACRPPDGMASQKLGSWDFHLEMKTPLAAHAHTHTCAHTPVSGQHVGSLHCHLHLVVMRHPFPPPWGGVRESLVESQGFCHCALVMSSPLPSGKSWGTVIKYSPSLN